MDINRVADLQKDLRKFKEIGPVRAKDILEYLRKQNLSREIIKETKISQTVVSVSQHKPDFENEHEMSMVQTAKKLVQQWQQLFKQQKKNSAQIQDKNSNSKKLAQDQVDTSKLQQDLEPRGRNVVLTALYKYMMVGVNGKNPDKINTICTEVEKKMFQRNSQMSQGESIALKYYKQDAEKLIDQMKNKPKFCLSILNDEYTITEISNLDQKLFLTEKQKEEQRKIKEQLEAENDVDFFKKRKEEMLKNSTAGELCPSCKKETAYCKQEVQIRGADEPMTRFMRCDPCDKDWQD